MLGVALFDLLPEAAELVGGDFQRLSLAVAIGFATYATIDRAAALFGAQDRERAHLGPAALTIHSFVDGLGIGLAFQVSPAAGLIVAIGVLAHDFADGVNTFVLAFSGGANTRTALLWLLADALAPLCGIAVSLLFAIGQHDLASALGVFCGCFLYVGASELLPQSMEKSVSRWSLLATPAGLAVIYAVVRLASP